MGMSVLTRRREPHSWRGPQACTRGCLGPREHPRGHMPALKVCVSHMQVHEPEAGVCGPGRVDCTGTPMW